MGGIRVKLVVLFSAIILVSSAILAFVSVNRASASLEAEAKKALQSMVNETAKVALSRIDMQKEVISLLSHMDGMESMDLDKQLALLKKQLPYTNFLDVGVVFPDGSTFYTDGSKSNLGERDYVKSALNGNLAVSDVLLSKVTNSLVLMYAAPIYRGQEIVGALVGRRDGSALSQVIIDSKLGQSGYAYIVNQAGTIVAHPDISMVMEQFNPLEQAKENSELQSVATLIDHVLVQEEGVETYIYEGRNLLAAYGLVEGYNWHLIVTADQDEILASIPLLQQEIIRNLVMLLAASVVMIVFVGNSIAAPLSRVAKRAQSVAQLDLTVSMPKKDLRRKDEIGKLANAMDVILAALRQIVQELHATSIHVAEEARGLKNNAGQSAMASDQLTMTVEEIAKGAFEQAQKTEQGSVKSAMLGEAIEQELKQINALSEAAEQVNSAVSNGLQEMQELNRVSLENKELSKMVYEVVQKTSDSSNRISDASQLITSIAKQTNILAINASIEAARAGEAGKGFAVVAKEIGQLAEQTAKSVQVILEVITDLQSNVQQAVVSIDDSQKIANQQLEIANASKDQFLQISSKASQMSSIVKALHEVSGSMDQSKNQIIDALHGLTAIAEENSAATQQASASIEEQSATLQEMAHASNGLADQAAALRKLVEKFHLS